MSKIADAEDFPDLDEGFVRKPNRLPLLLLGIAVLGTIVAVGYTMFTRSVVYYHTPTEVLRMPGEHVRLSGTVVAGSIATDPSAGTVSFSVTDGTSTVPVVYHGPAPDTLRDRGEAVVEGALGADGVFRAEVLFAKCPSKFEAKVSPGGSA
jgi:cytochrome c-type biogenesis protein CcmE